MKTFLKFVAALLVVFMILLGILYYGITSPKTVNVTWTKEDLNSYMKKTHSSLTFEGTAGAAKDTPSQLPGSSSVNPSGNSSGNSSQLPSSLSGKGPANLEDLLFNNFQTKGSVAVNDFLTASEVTAMINTVSRGNTIFRDVKIGFREDGTMEASAYLGSALGKLCELFPEVKKYESIIKQAEGKPIYWRYSLLRVSNKKFDGHTQELRLGQIPLPLSQTGEGLKSAGTAVNNMIANLNGFSCEEFKIDKQGMHFKGSIPTGLGYKQDSLFSGNFNAR